MVPSWPTSQRLSAPLGEAVAAARGLSLSAWDVDVYKGQGEGRTGGCWVGGEVWGIGGRGWTEGRIFPSMYVQLQTKES